MQIIQEANMARDYYACVNNVFSIPLPWGDASYPIMGYCDADPTLYVFATLVLFIIGLIVAIVQFSKSLSFYRESWWVAFLWFFFLSLGFLVFSIVSMAKCNSYGCQLASPLVVASNWYFPVFVLFTGLFILSGMSKLGAGLWYMTTVRNQN